MQKIEDSLSYEIIGAAIEVHKELGPGLLESAFHACLARELELRNIPFLQQVPLPVEYKGLRVECGYRMDFLVADKVIVEIKAVEALNEIHEAQCLTYLKFSGRHLCLLINFNVLRLKEGVQRIVKDL